MNQKDQSLNHSRSQPNNQSITNQRNNHRITDLHDLHAQLTSDLFHTAQPRP